MHLWPSTMLRDSFKSEYLRTVEWNLRRMKSEKQKNQQQQQQSSSIERPLLDDEGGGPKNNGGAAVEETPRSVFVCGFLRLCGDVVMVMSCFYCCFCCGGKIPVVPFSATPVYERIIIFCSVS
ncbi:hypothetical protein CDL15_Pgr026038 [Punica granatum]|uniref:Uncharacterized protein n=1 Tax=Punica granatum TaxID=22663 RepID=A0A218WCJ6_PUNGR|nr:hypothetical protein CDL15_Pgr026038 [Punica granatum]